MVVLASAIAAVAPAVAADAVDLRPVALALDTAHCPAVSAAAVAGLPATCFERFAARPETIRSTYVTPAESWLRFTVPPQAVADGRWDLHLSFMVHHGTLTVIAPSGTVRAQEELGMDIPTSARPVPTYDDRVPLPREVVAGDTIVLHLSSMRVQFAPLELRSAESLRERDERDARFYGPLAFLCGMLFAMALFNLLFYALLRGRSYLLYSLSMLAMIVFQTVQSGLAWTLFWPWAGVRDDAPAYIAYLAYFVLVTAFARSFLDLRAIAPRTDRILLIALGALIVDATVYVAFPGLVAATGLWQAIDPLVVCFMIVMLLVAGVVAVRKNVVAARYYVIGFAGAAIGLCLTEAADYVLLPLPEWADLCSAAGVAWEAIFLAFALAERIRFAEREATRLSDYAYRDQLTGIPNRRAFDEAFENEWRRGVRSGRTLSLVMFDIDHFKAYNDRFGHQQGDVALRAVAAEILRAARRPGDFAARYGGEEFSVVLAETSAEGAVAAAETVRDAVRALGILFDGKPLTVSAGCATVLPVDGERAATLLARADGALYAAKTGGRDRTVAADSVT